jgi:hypothetical protein
MFNYSRRGVYKRPGLERHDLRKLPSSRHFVTYSSHGEESF